MHSDITKTVKEVTIFTTQLFPAGKNVNQYPSITRLVSRSQLLTNNLQPILSNDVYLNHAGLSTVYGERWQPSEPSSQPVVVMLTFRFTEACNE